MYWWGILGKVTKNRLTQLDPQKNSVRIACNLSGSKWRIHIWKDTQRLIRSSPIPCWSHPSLLSLQWLTSNMSGMVHQDLTQFFISCLLLISCTSVDKKHRLSDRMRPTLRVLYQLSLCLKMTERNAKMVPPENTDLFIPRFSTISWFYWKILIVLKICLQKALVNTRPTHQSPTRSSNCSREMPEAVSHPNWEHISLLFGKRKTHQNTFFKSAEVFEIGDPGGVEGKVQ